MSDSVRKSTGGQKKAMDVKVYVVVPTNFEYNDETYRAEGHGLPVKAFTDVAAAEALALQLSVEKLSEGYPALGEMGYDPGEVFDDGGQCLVEQGICTEEDLDQNMYDLDLDPSTWTHEQREAVLAQLRNPLFEVVEVEKG